MQFQELGNVSSSVAGFFNKDIVYKVTIGVVWVFTILGMILGMYVKVRSWVKKKAALPDTSSSNGRQTKQSTPLFSTPAPDTSLVTAGVQAITPFIRSRMRKWIGMNRSLSMSDLEEAQLSYDFSPREQDFEFTGDLMLTPRSLIRAYVQERVINIGDTVVGDSDGVSNERESGVRFSATVAAIHMDPDYSNDYANEDYSDAMEDFHEGDDAETIPKTKINPAAQSVLFEN